MVVWQREVSESFASSHSEKHPSKPFLIFIPDRASYKLNLYTALGHKRLLALALHVGVTTTNASNLVGLGRHKVEHLAVVDKLVQRLLHSGDRLHLLLDEFLLFNNVLLDAVKKKVDGAFAFCGHRCNLLVNLGGTGGLCHFDFEFFALADEVADAALGLVALANAEAVGQLVRLHLLVEVDEVGKVAVSDFFCDAPHVVLGDGDAVQLHLLRPTHFHSSFGCTYLKIGISL